MSTDAPGLLDRAQALLARGILGLPAPALRVLAGGRAVEIDGQQLETEVQVLLRLQALAGERRIETMHPSEVRAWMRNATRAIAGETLPVAHVEDRRIPGPVGALGARLYRPFGGTEARPLVVFFHGGGWVAGDLETHDGVCRFLAIYGGVNVLAVDYRCAPEHRFPAAVDDALAAFRFAVAEAASLGSDPARVAVAGDSAGGNLAAVVAQLAARDGGPRPVFQLLIYPVTDVSTKHPSYRLFREGFLLTEKGMDWYRAQYLGDASIADDPRVSPLRATALAGVAPAHVVTAGFDVLRDEGEAYVRALEKAGVAATLQREPGQVHGFANATGVGLAAKRAMERACMALRAGLGIAGV